MGALISLVVTTYNRPDALSAVLHGLGRQSDRGFEVIVADDGSGPATADLLRRTDIGVPLKHVWQADDGFRAAEARNRALLASEGAYVVFLDGDCVPRPTFIERHRALAEPGWFVAGHRILLSERATSEILARGERVEDWPLWRWAAARATGAANRLLPLLTLPDGAWRRREPDRWRGVRTCNLAVWRADLARIDGFDAAYQGWGLEDTDLALRLMRAGVKRKDGRFGTGVLHLWHREYDRSKLPENAARLEAVKTTDRVRAERGLSSLEDAPA